MTRIVLDAANIRDGGALQVAISIVDELARGIVQGTLPPYAWLPTVHMRLSSELYDRIGARTLPFSTSVSRRVGRLPFVELGRREPTLQIFGPAYRIRRPPVWVMGYADVTTVYGPHGDVSPAKSGARWLRSSLSRASVRSASRVLVETAAFKKDVAQKLDISEEKISVVPNALNRSFVSGEREILMDWGRARRGVDVLLGYPAAGYSHKNHRVLGEVGQVLKDRYQVRARFIVTLTPTEWLALDESVRAVCLNLGRVAVDELQSLYRNVDFCIFPSLMEVYSATPIEAAWSGTPLIASDRNFVRTILGDDAWYFSPTDPADIAKTIWSAVSEPERTATQVNCARATSAKLPSATERLHSMLAIMDGELKAWKHPKADTGRGM